VKCCVLVASSAHHEACTQHITCTEVERWIGLSKVSQEGEAVLEEDGTTAYSVWVSDFRGAAMRVPAACSASSAPCCLIHAPTAVYGSGTIIGSIHIETQN
jgi:hypothetical protein